MITKVGINMEWTITVNEEKQYAEIVTSGIADRDGSLEMAKAISLAMREKNINRSSKYSFNLG